MVKIKDAVKHSIEIINLRRLHNFFLGQLMFETVKELEKLTIDSFKGAAYEATGAPILTQPKNASSN